MKYYTEEGRTLFATMMVDLHICINAGTRFIQLYKLFISIHNNSKFKLRWNPLVKRVEKVKKIYLHPHFRSHADAHA